MNRQLLQMDFHRNGVAGTAFYVALFLDTDGSRKVAIWFGSNDATREDKDNFAISVMDVDKLAAGSVLMFNGELSNAWRGDNYLNDMIRWVQEWEENLHKNGVQFSNEVQRAWDKVEN
jgi:hypothetical protein